MIVSPSCLRRSWGVRRATTSTMCGSSMRRRCCKPRISRSPRLLTNPASETQPILSECFGGRQGSPRASIAGTFWRSPRNQSRWNRFPYPHYRRPDVMKSILRRTTLCMLLLSVLSGAVSASEPVHQEAGRDTLPAPSPAAYRQFAGEAEANLQAQVLAKWFPAALDTAQGGFHQNFHEDWTRDPKSDKSLVY